MHNLDRQAVAIDYGDDGLHRFRRARTRLSAGGRSQTFSNSHSRRTGLESYHEAAVLLAPGGAATAFALDGDGVLRSRSLVPGAEWTAVPGLSPAETCTVCGALT